MIMMTGLERVSEIINQYDLEGDRCEMFWTSKIMSPFKVCVIINAENYFKFFDIEFYMSQPKRFKLSRIFMQDNCPPYQERLVFHRI